MQANQIRGNPAAVCEERVSDWAAEGTIRWLGHVEDMPSLLRSTDIAVLPSYREGLPKGLIEAGACGLAIVSTDVPGCREVVDHEVDGLIVPVRDSLALANAILRLCEDGVLRERLGSAARKKAVRRFDERIVNAQTIDLYQELVADR